jgi:lysyl-tRNA synthetase class 1
MQIPETIEAVIDEFDRNKEPLSTHSVQAALSGARTKLEHKIAISDAWADLVAFTLAAEQEDRPPWNTYLGPMGTGTDRDGNEVYFPDIQQLTPEIVGHWEHRADALTHPVMKARYADLVWDLSKRAANRRPDVRFARIAIDSYIASVADGRNAETHDDVEALKRALQLATSLRDDERTGIVKDMMIAKFHVEAEKNGRWEDIYDSLATNRKCRLSADEKGDMVARLETLLAAFTEQATLNPHGAQSVASRLFQVYSAVEDFDSVKRVALDVSEVFERIAGGGSRMQAMAWLQTASEFARRAGDEERYNRLRVERAAAIRDSASEMATFSHTETIKKSDVEDFVNILIGEKNWQQSLFNIAARFIVPKQELRHRATEGKEKYPLMSMIPMSLIADDHVAAQVGGDDEDGALYRYADYARQSNRLFLSEALDAAVERHKLSPEEVAAFVQRTGLFSNFHLVISGIKAWIDGDYVKCLFVLVPQIEDAFRCLARGLGEPVTKEKRGQKGWEVSANLGDLLSMEKVKAEVGEDIHFWIRAIFADARGMNLRNLVAHGLASREAASYYNCDLIIHSMLMLGAYKDVAAACIQKAEAQQKRRVETKTSSQSDDDFDAEDLVIGVTNIRKGAPAPAESTELRKRRRRRRPQPSKPDECS